MRNTHGQEEGGKHETREHKAKQFAELKEKGKATHVNKCKL